MKFRKKILNLLIFVLFYSSFLLFVNQKAFAQELNYCLTGVSEFNKISLVGSGINWVGVASDINDDNVSTYMGFGDAVPPNGQGYSGEFEGIVTFTGTISEIRRVEYELIGITDGFNDNRIIKTYLWYDGAWNEIDSRSIGYGPEVIIDGPWYNVEKVKIYVKADSGTRVCRKAEGCDFKWQIKELRAWGPEYYYQDIGLRVYDGIEIVPIAAEIGVPTSPLRIAKNGTIYGIVLVDPLDICASRVRIQTISGTKALAVFGCSYPYTVADSTTINPNLVRRSLNPDDLIQIALIFNSYELSEFNQTAPLTLYPGGAKSIDQIWFSGGGNVRVIGLFRRGDIMDTIAKNGEINARVYGEMIVPKRFFYGETIFFISLFTGS